MEIKDEETVEQRTDRAYAEAVETVKGSKTTTKEVKIPNDPVMQEAMVKQGIISQEQVDKHNSKEAPVNGRQEASMASEQQDKNRIWNEQIASGAISPELQPKITNQPVQPLMEKTSSTTITRSRKPATTVKSVDTDSLILKMKEQIRLIEHVSQVDTEISAEGLSKEGREVLIIFQRAIEKVKADTVTAIQSI